MRFALEMDAQGRFAVLVQVDFLHEKGYLQTEHKETYIDEAGRGFGHA